MKMIFRRTLLEGQTEGAIVASTLPDEAALTEIASVPFFQHPVQVYHRALQPPFAGRLGFVILCYADGDNPMNRFYVFGNFRLDALRRTLFCDDQAVPLAPKAFEMMLVLVENHGSILSKDDLFRRVWPNTIVEENNLTVIISILRKVLGENPNDHRYIVTIPGKGYRFVADVTEVALEESADAASELQPVDSEPAAQTSPQRVRRRVSRFPAIARWSLAAGVLVIVGTLALSGGRFTETKGSSIAILPFKPLAAAAADPYLGLGLADVVITRLCNLHNVVVRPTSAVLRYAGLNQDPVEAGRTLKVDSVVDGHFQILQDHIRLTIQVIRVRDGEILWSETLDDKFSNLFSMQDVVSDRVVQALMIRLKAGEKERLGKRYTVDAKAYHLYLYGRYFWNRRTPDGRRKAAEYFTKAIARDPSFALAYAGLADSYCLFDY
jgi:DNA-binding winged helix-turn-helix (wHTH) protein/TolB-like protein